jgi:hypothetical protein
MSITDFGDACCGLGDDIEDDDNRSYNSWWPDQHLKPHKPKGVPSVVTRAVDGEYSAFTAGFRHVVVYKFVAGVDAEQKRTVVRALAKLPDLVTDSGGDPLVVQFSFGHDLKFAATHDPACVPGRDLRLS